MSSLAGFRTEDSKKMKLPSEQTLYHIMIFLLTLMVILGILFDTDFA